MGCSYNLLKFLTLLFFVLFFPIFNFYDVSADSYTNSTLNVSAYVVEPTSSVDISPSTIYLGEITKGYSTGLQNITLTNSGSLDIKIQPVLDSSANSVFQNVKFGSATCSTWTSIGNWISGKISKPVNYGGVSNYNFCIKLDLGSYTQEITNNQNLSKKITLWIMPY